MVTLKGQFAQRGQTQSLVQGHQALAPEAGRHGRAEGAKWHHHQAQMQAIALRAQLRAQACIARHFFAGGGVAVQLEQARQHAQRGIQFFLGVHRYRPVLGDQLGHPALRRRDADQACAIRRIAHDAHAVLSRQRRFVAGGTGVFEETRFVLGGQRRVDAEHEAVTAARVLGARRRGGLRFAFVPGRRLRRRTTPHLKRGQPFAELDHLLRRIGEAHRRMLHQGQHRGHRIERQQRRSALALDRARDGGIARIESHALFHPREADRLRSAPAARALGALERHHVFDPAVAVDMQLPQQGHRRRGFRIAAG